MQPRRFLPITRWAVALGVLAAVLFAYRHWVHVNPTTVSLTLVLYVLILAAQWEPKYAIVISILATAGYNFYFLPPLNTFTISDPQNWLALFTFLCTSIVGSRLSQSARREAENALRRQRELEPLYLLGRELLQTESVAAAVQAIPSLINTSAHAESVVLYLLDGDRLYQSGIHPEASIEVSHFRQTALRLSFVTMGSDNEIFVPIRTGVRRRGLLVVRSAGLTTESLEAVGGLVSITLDRAQGIENAAKEEANMESERLRTLILDSITHELRTPLTSIKGSAGALLADASIQAGDQKELVSIIDEEADRLNRLIGQAVEMARIEAREVQMHLESLSMRDVVNEALQNCVWVADDHLVSVDIPGDFEVFGDRELLVKVMCNLLENAGKYSDSGTPIVVTAAVQGNVLETSVADRGFGIDSSEQALIVDRLYRSRTQCEGTPGTGMGLAISRAIVQAHRGHINVSSQLGHGSIFTFTLPLAAR